MTEYSVFIKIRTVWPNTVYSQNLHCMFEYNIFLKFTLYVRVQCIFHINTTRLSVVHFHVKHYTIEYNVFVEYPLYIVSFEIMCIQLCHNLLHKLWQRGATVDTQFRDNLSWMRQKIQWWKFTVKLDLFDLIYWFWIKL